MFNLKNPQPESGLVYTMPNALSDTALDIIKKNFKEQKFHSGGTFDAQSSHIRNSEIVWLPVSNDTIMLYNEIAYLVESVNKHHYNFNLTYIETLQHAKYTAPSGNYNWHCDDTLSAPISRKLSFSILLTPLEEYEGGNLEISGFDLEPVDYNTAIFFPSIVPHRVATVTKGIRQSLVGWCCGPKFI